MSANISTQHAAQDRAFELMSEHLPHAVADLFAGYELAVWSAAPHASRTLEREVAASIGFTGSGVRGALLLKASETSIACWLQALGMPGGDPVDTLSEFSNMLLGRLKSRLLREGLPITLATPTATMGSGLRFSVPPPKSVSLAFDGADWSVTVRVDASFEADFVIDASAAEDAAEAGECILF